MNLLVTNIQIDYRYTNEVTWVKTNGASLRKGMALKYGIDNPLKFEIDEYTLENPGEIAIITVKTDNNIYKDIELVRCVPNCDCDIFDVSLDENSSKYLPRSGGTVIFNYSLKDKFVGKCDISTLTCHTKASYARVVKNTLSNNFAVTFGENFSSLRKARIIFSYGDTNCQVFTISQAGRGECDGVYIIKASKETISCSGDTLIFTHEGGPSSECVYYEISSSKETISCNGETITFTQKSVCSDYTINADKDKIDCSGSTITFTHEGGPTTKCTDYTINADKDKIDCNGSTITFSTDGGGGSDTDFTKMLNEFNNVLTDRNITKITKTGTPKTYSYLETLFNEAVNEFNNKNSKLFDKTTYDEVFDYRTGATKNHDLGLSAMTSWLMAMQISEIVANSGKSTNNQTEVFKKAYNIGGGKSQPIYGYSDLRSDLIICRLAASAIYARNKKTYGFDEIDVMRGELGTSVNNRTNMAFDQFGYETGPESGICDNTYDITIGYACALNDILPAAAGPYATKYFLVGGIWCEPSNPTADERQPDQYQPQNQFNAETKNYIVDEQIYDYVINNYTLYSKNGFFERTVQAVVDEFTDTEELFGNNTYYKCYNDFPKYSFTPGKPDDNDGYFKGVFNSGVTGYDLSTKSSQEDDFGYFIHNIATMSDRSKKPIGDKQYGRRRPSQGEEDMSARCVCCGGYDSRCYDGFTSQCSTQNNLLDYSIERMIGTGTRRNSAGDVYYVDIDGNAYFDNGEPFYGETPIYIVPNECVKQNSTSYPSGHSSRIWGVALMLIDMIPNSDWLKIYKAAYAYTVSRTMVRAHWNSDILLGKLAATTFVPVLYSFNEGTRPYYNFRTRYNMAKQQIIQ